MDELVKQAEHEIVALAKRKDDEREEVSKQMAKKVARCALHIGAAANEISKHFCCGTA